MKEGGTPYALQRRWQRQRRRRRQQQQQQRQQQRAAFRVPLALTSSQRPTMRSPCFSCWPSRATCRSLASTAALPDCTYPRGAPQSYVSPANISAQQMRNRCMHHQCRNPCTSCAR